LAAKTSFAKSLSQAKERPGSGSIATYTGQGMTF